MGRAVGRLKPVELPRVAKRRGMHCDGGGLYLCVVPPNGCSWVYRFMLAGRARTMGIGPYPEITLAEARALAVEARRVKILGKDPIAERDAARTAQRLEDAKAMTFDQCRDAFIKAHSAGWRNVKHASQWTNTLTSYVTPIFGGLPVQAVDVALVTKALDPIWTTKPETAGRVRGRIESILDWATARGFRTGENPARWKGHLDKLYPARSKVKAKKREQQGRGEHHAALPYLALPDFMTALRERLGTSARALEFTILTAARTGETLGALWPEFDLAARVWIVPAARMKGGREHRVPLSDAAVAMLKRMDNAEKSAHVFSSDRGAALSNMAMDMLLRRMGRKDATVHGFRSTFRDWAAECTSFPREVAEAALAHIVGDKVEAAYRRGDLFEKRRELMEAWAKFCASGAAKQPKVTPLNVHAGART
jgi:integrase